MNILAPVSSIMTTNLHTVGPEDTLENVKTIFDEHNIHHIPVVKYKTIVGIVSQTDFLYFLRGFVRSDDDRMTEAVRLRAWKVKDIMTEKLAKVESTDTIRTALDVFKTNRVHALPVVDNNEIVGIITTFDIVKKLADEPINLEDYKIG